MPIVRFLNASKDVTVNTVPYTLVTETTGDDKEESIEKVGGATPLLRNGISKDGKCRVIAADGGANSQPLATLLALRSPVGYEGDYTVYVNGTAHAYHSLVSVSTDGAFVQFVVLEWNGTIEE